ncbi:reverse transcriptase family protein [Photobacterium profundum]|uniref:Reverse transcriptase domain-containing protein n=1 Tax=Photobacterium profundum (strain SS9) TaxID=298386 RepID=Q6LJU9_PHOPR|nr:reverse transcriptase family protein [Photobacterium profundum]CAG22431.1 hypothetical protein PBPRB0558 [Photobacterium profundum SS9]
MNRKRSKKLKIQTNGKSYTIKDSPLYRLRSKKKLANILKSDLNNLKKLRLDADNYHEFEDKGKGGKPRKIQCPCNGLEKIHSRIASLLCRIKTPDYLQSGKKGHSNVSNANVHLGSSCLLATDIKSFFPSTKRYMLFSFFFHSMECSADVADILSDLCTINGHIPTGSQISMPLAFWANSHMFDELYLLSVKHAVKMTVYVDDLTFSGDAVNKLFMSVTQRIITKHNQVMHPDKTKLYRGYESKLITGVVVKGDNLLVRNEQHKMLFSDVECWKAIKDIPSAINSNIAKKVIGRMHSMSVIDSKFKDKVRTLRISTAT